MTPPRITSKTVEAQKPPVGINASSTLYDPFAFLTGFFTEQRQSTEWKTVNFLSDILRGTGYTINDVIAVALGHTNPDTRGGYIANIYLTSRGLDESLQPPLKDHYDALAKRAISGRFEPLKDELSRWTGKPRWQDENPSFINLGGNDALNRVLVLYATEDERSEML